MVVGMREEVDVSDGASGDLAARLSRGESVGFVWLSNKNDHYSNYGIESD